MHISLNMDLKNRYDYRKETRLYRDLNGRGNQDLLTEIRNERISKMVAPAKLVVDQKKTILKMHQLGMYDGQMAIQVAKFLGICGTLKDGNALKCLRMSYHILTTLKGTSYTIDDRNKLYNKFQSTFLKKLMPKKNIFHNNITEVKGGEGKRLIKAINKVVQSKEGEKHRRRLLNWKNHWEQFTTYVETTKGSCPESILTGVIVKPTGEFYFSCSQSPKLCDCIEHVADSSEEQTFAAGNIGLAVFLVDGTVGYEISEDGEAFAYGDVNEGKNARRRRRRLLQSRGGGS